jgi:small redox-active disulfide protein 2
MFVILRTTNKLKAMEIKILGTGCPKCKALEKETLKALDEMGLNVNVEKVEDIMKIMSYGVLRTPGLVINEKVVHSGSVPSINEIKSLINQNQ